VHPKWYVAAIGIPAIVALGSGAVLQLAGGPVDFASFAFDPVSLGIGILLGTTIGGGQEELGWRGFAQPELQEQYGGLRAAVIIGVLWGGWHLPLFFDPTAVHSQWPLRSQLAYFVGIILCSCRECLRAPTALRDGQAESPIMMAVNLDRSSPAPVTAFNDSPLLVPELGARYR
jgi:hypothetical protein